MFSVLVLKISSVIRYSGGSQPRKATTTAVKFHKTKEKPINQNEDEAGGVWAPVSITPHPLPPIPTPTHCLPHTCLFPLMPTPTHAFPHPYPRLPMPIPPTHRLPYTEQPWESDRPHSTGVCPGPLTFVPQAPQQQGQQSHCALTMIISNPRKKGINKIAKFREVHWLLLLATRWGDRECEVLLRLQSLHWLLPHQQALGSLGSNCCSVHQSWAH